MDTRRAFLTSLTLAGISWCSVATVVMAQIPDLRPPQEPRPGQEPAAPEGPALPNPEKKILEDNDKDMKKKVERLYELASQLKEQVDKTDSSKVMSLNLMKKAEEIEKLAREIKNRSKG